MTPDEIDAFLDSLTAAELLLLRSWRLQATVLGRPQPTLDELRKRLEGDQQMKK